MSFEQEWRDKMLYANVTPNENVWEGIALHLSQNRKKKDKKRWFVWWVAAMFPLLLGDGKLNWQSKGDVLFSPPEYQKVSVEHSVEQQTPFVKKETTITQKTCKPKSAQPIVFQATADYELASENILSRGSKETTPLELLGKPKARRWWIQTYSALEQNHSVLSFNSLTPVASRSPFASPAIALVEKNIKKELESRTPLVSWRAGLDMGYQATKHWYVATGVHFNRSIVSLDVDGYNEYPEIAKFYGNVPVTIPPVHVATSINPTTETIVPESSDNVPITSFLVEEKKPKRFLQKTDYINIPIKVGYQIQRNHLRYAMAIGAEGSYLLNNSFQSTNNQLNQVVEHLNRYQVSAIAEVSVGFLASDKILLHVSPQFRKAFVSPFASNSPLQQVSNSTLGISGGVQYRF